MNPFRIQGLDHIAISVRDQAAAIDWYADVLGLERRHPEWGDFPAMLCAGETCIALFPASEVETAGGSPENGMGLRHFAFRVDAPSFERAQDELQRRGIDFRFSDHGTAHSIYFSDLDGYKLELTTYEV